MSLTLIRTDATSLIGSGHLMRCLNLAHGLRHRGQRVIFICRIHDDSIHRNLINTDFELVELPPLPPLKSTLHESYLDWLGCSQEQDLRDTLLAIKSYDLNEPFYAVVDHYALDSIWENAFQIYFPLVKLLAIDDLANRKHSAHYLLDSGLDVNRYSSSSELVVSSCKLYLGPQYALLSSDYSSFLPLPPVRTRLRRILVFLGGVDSHNFTLNILEELISPSYHKFKIDVVLGSASPHKVSVSRFISNSPNISLHIGLPSLSHLIARADLAIGAGGSSAWERACLGLPSIIIPIASNQISNSHQLQRVGAAVPLFFNSVNDLTLQLRSALAHIEDNPGILQRMSTDCFQLTDGRGVQRIITSLLGPNYPLSIRDTEFFDLYLYFWWVNDPLVRQFSINPDIISFQDHSDWFKFSISSDDILMYILLDSSGFPLGQIRFERLPATPNSRQIVKLSLSLDPVSRGYGLSSSLLTMGIRSMLSSWSSPLMLFAQVFPSNIPSLNLFLNNGFVEIASSTPGMREFQLQLNEFSGYA